MAYDVANEDYSCKFIGECLGSKKTTRHIVQEKNNNSKTFKEIKIKQQFWHHDVANEDYPWKLIGECLGSKKTTQHILQEKTTNQNH